LTDGHVPGRTKQSGSQDSRSPFPLPGARFSGGRFLGGRSFRCLPARRSCRRHKFPGAPRRAPPAGQPRYRSRCAGLPQRHLDVSRPCGPAGEWRCPRPDRSGCRWWSPWTHRYCS